MLLISSVRPSPLRPPLCPGLLPASRCPDRVRLSIADPGADQILPALVLRHTVVAVSIGGLQEILVLLDGETSLRDRGLFGLRFFQVGQTGIIASCPILADSIEGEKIFFDQATWDAVDLTKGELKICKQLQHQGDQDILVPLKNSKPRYLTIPPTVTKLLRDAETHQKEQRLKAGSRWQGWTNREEMKTSPVFLRDDGRTMSAAALYQRYKHLAAGIGIPDSRVHDLRHTYAVLSLQNGDNVKTVQDNLGHATAAFTLDVYGHVSDKMKDDSAAKMEEYIRRMA